MLIKEVIENTNTFPLLEQDLLNDKQKVAYKGNTYTWDEANQQFSVKVNDIDTPVEQGSRLEYEILKSAGIVKSGGQLQPTVKARFKNLFKSKTPGVLGRTKQDMDSQDGISKKAGAMIGSIVGRGLDKMFGGPNEKFPLNLQMHFISKKGEPINVLLQQEFNSKDLKDMVKKGELVQVKTKQGNRTFGISPAKLITGFAK